MPSGIARVFGTVRDRVRSAVGADRSKTMLAMLAPPKGQSLIARVAILGGALAGLASMTALAGGALLLLLVALGVLYWILTSVLGLELSVDPRAAYEALSRAAPRR